MGRWGEWVGGVSGGGCTSPMLGKGRCKAGVPIFLSNSIFPSTKAVFYQMYGGEDPGLRGCILQSWTEVVVTPTPSPRIQCCHIKSLFNFDLGGGRVLQHFCPGL